MNKKPKNKGSDASQKFEEFDVTQNLEESFEDFDVTQEPIAEDESSIEMLGGLSESEDELRSLQQAQAEITRSLLIALDQKAQAVAADGPNGLGNIIGVGLGEKEVGGIPTGQLAVKVFVKEKLGENAVASEALIPQSLGGIATDVDAIGEVYANAFTARMRPAPAGVSIGNCRMVMAGTLGCLVRRGNQLFLLSNNHVIALVNSSPLGTGIPQPGRLDGGICNQDVIARLTQFIPINFAAGQCNFVDAAIAQTSSALVDRRVIRPGNVRQPLVSPDVPAALNMMVQKSGRTTQYRRGLVNAINVTVDVSYAPLGGVARFCRQFSVRGTGGIFSDRGDSGSLVTTFPRNQPTGLLFAGNAANNITFCNPIRTVLSLLNVQILY